MAQIPKPSHHRQTSENGEVIYFQNPTTVRYGYNSNVGPNMDTLEKAKNLMSKLSLADVILKKSTKELFVVTRIDENKMIVKSVGGREYELSYINFVKEYEIVIDNNGEITVQEQLQFLKNNDMMSLDDDPKKLMGMMNDLLRGEIRRIKETAENPNLKKRGKPTASTKFSSVVKPGDHIMNVTIENPAVQRVVTVDPFSKKVVLLNTSSKREHVVNFSNLDENYTFRDDYIPPTKLTDVLKKGDVISSIPGKNGWKDAEVIFVDRIAKVVTIEDGTTLKFDDINSGYTRIGDVNNRIKTPKANLPVLVVTEVKEIEVYHAYYMDTRQDRRYERYCKKLGRDYPQTKRYTNEFKKSVERDKIIPWLQAHLEPEELVKLKEELNVLKIKLPEKKPIPETDLGLEELFSSETGHLSNDQDDV